MHGKTWSRGWRALPALVVLAALSTAGCDLAAKFPDPDRDKRADSTAVQPVQVPREDPVPLEMPEVLGSLARWDSASPEQKRAAAEAISKKWKRFQFTELQTFSAGGQTHEMALYTHEISGLEFALIPGGSFKMGSPRGESRRKDDEVQHEVILTEPFLISRTEVTQDAWMRKWDMNPAVHVNPQNPAENMSGYDANRWCRRIKCNFPTEAQWEYAARAGTTTAYAGGKSTSDLDSMGWYEGNAGEKAHAVAQKRPNAFGLYDMHGNVWEWTADVWQKHYPKGTVTDPTGSDQKNDYRATRGGSWGNPAGPCRSAFRIEFHLSDKHGALGFRAAKTLSWK